MIITKRVKINITSRYINHYLSCGYNVKVGDTITIDVNDLMKTSHHYVDVICDMCGISGSTQYRRVVNKEKYLCHKCSIKKNGNIFQIEEIKNKIKNTNIEKYGVEYPLQNAKILERLKTTNLKKYNCENVFQSECIKNKIKEIILKKYGVKHYMCLDYIKNKVKNTTLKKYGVEHAMQNNKIKEKSLNKRRNYILNFILESFKNENIISIDYENKIYKLKCDCNKNHTYKISSKLLLNRKYNSKTTLCTICNPVHSNTSDRENKLLQFIREHYTGEIIENSRQIISPYEIDIFLPDLKLAFEFNGLYWHSELYKDKNYHKIKTDLCEEKNIKLLHIWEDDWDYKKEIVKSIILNQLDKINNNIDIEKCEVIEIVDNSLIENFLNENHIQGFINSNINIGLFFKNELVSLMSFMNKNDEIELLRFCNKINIKIKYSENKLFKYFLNRYKPLNVKCYIDRSYTNDISYNGLGFNLSDISEPNYYYIFNKKRNKISESHIKIYDVGYKIFNYTK